MLIKTSVGHTFQPVTIEVKCLFHFLGIGYLKYVQLSSILEILHVCTCWFLSNYFFGKSSSFKIIKPALPHNSELKYLKNDKADNLVHYCAAVVTNYYSLYTYATMYVSPWVLKRALKF